MIVTVVDGVVEPDYAQFYIKSPEADWCSDEVSTQGYEAHLEAINGFVYVGTYRQSGTTPVRIEIYDSEPPDPDARWQHVVEVSLTTTGLLEIYHWDPDSPAFTVAVPAGSVRLRALWTGLVEDRPDGVDDGNSDERLLFQVWSAALGDAVVRRWWSEWRLPESGATSTDGRRQIEGTELVCDRLLDLRRLPVYLMYPDRRLVLSGEPEGSMLAIYGDVTDGTWWADGYAVRRTLREVTGEEVRRIVADVLADPERPKDPFAKTQEQNSLEDRQSASDHRWLEMLASVDLPASVA